MAVMVVVMVVGWYAEGGRAAQKYSQQKQTHKHISIVDRTPTKKCYEGAARRVSYRAAQAQY
jgi:hypothetical protein